MSRLLKCLPFGKRDRSHPDELAKSQPSLTSSSSGTLYSTPFGKPMLKHFQFASDWKPMNHGSLGTYPTYIRDLHRRLQEEHEARPDWWIRYEYPPALLKSREAVARLVNADANDLVLIQNSTTGFNVVGRSLVWAEGDHIVYYRLTFGPNQLLIKYLEETTAARGLCMDVELPASDDELVAAFEATVRAVNARPGCRARLAVFDTVTSMPGLRLPYERLVRSARELGVLSFVDGAQGIGQIPLDLRATDPDFFVSNLHKWLFVPRSLAMLYVPKRNQPLIRSSLPTSYAYKPRDAAPASSSATDAGASDPKALSAFVELFQYVATLDTQNYLTVPAALEWRQKVCGGEEVIRDYIRRLAREGGDWVARVLGTEVMDHPGTDIRECAFANVRMPIEIGDEKESQVKEEDIRILIEWMEHYGCVTYGSMLRYFFLKGAIWCRLSGQIYLDLDDFKQTADRLQNICDIVGRGREAYLQNGKCKICSEIENGRS